MSILNRRRFLTATSVAMASTVIPDRAGKTAGKKQNIIDLHQHTNYSGRSNDRMLRHQRALGVTWTVLLPAGRKFGLGANCGGNDSVREIVIRNPRKYVCFANEIADHPECIPTIEKYLKKGAIGIGEQKFNVECDSGHIRKIAELARDYEAPVLMHFQHGTYNTGIARFHKILEAFPSVNFIGHAQTWWGNIDKNHDPKVMYPKGAVTPGGITDRLLSDYPNMYGDLSAGSGLNSLIRDETHSRGFLERHQDKLIYGSDCNDPIGRGPSCQGARTIATLRRLSPNQAAMEKMLHKNIRKIVRIPA